MAEGTGRYVVTGLGERRYQSRPAAMAAAEDLAKDYPGQAFLVWNGSSLLARFRAEEVQVTQIAEGEAGAAQLRALLGFPAEEES